jgi:hypothetical protein
MTATSGDPVDAAAGRRRRRTDELEHWLTDLRVTLSDGTLDWLEGARDDLVPGPSTMPPPTEDHTRRDSRTTARSADPKGSLDGYRSRPAAGRHRAAD